MWFLRRMLKISWTDKISNENILIQTNERRKIIMGLRKRQSKFIGHILRKGKLEHLVTTGKIIGRRDRGRQREKILDGLTKWHWKKLTTELIATVRNREMWKKMTANVCRQGSGWLKYHFKVKRMHFSITLFFFFSLVRYQLELSLRLTSRGGLFTPDNYPGSRVHSASTGHPFALGISWIPCPTCVAS